MITIEIIPNGVRTYFFKSNRTEKKYDLILYWKHDYRTYVISLEYLANEIFHWINKPSLTSIGDMLVASLPHGVKALVTWPNWPVTGMGKTYQVITMQPKIFVPDLIGKLASNKLLESNAIATRLRDFSMLNKCIRSINEKDISNMG